MKPVKLLVAAVLVVLVALGVTAVATAQSDDEKIVLTVGTEDVDSFNPLVGVEVPDYEAWNLHYATLTDKAAADFADDPRASPSRGRRRTAGRPTRTRCARA